VLALLDDALPEADGTSLQVTEPMVGGKELLEETHLVLLKLCWHIAFTTIRRNIILASQVDLFTNGTLHNMSCKPLKAFMATSTLLEGTRRQT
jgi:hypothetical protein